MVICYTTDNSRDYALQLGISLGGDATGQILPIKAVSSRWSIEQTVIVVDLEGDTSLYPSEILKCIGDAHRIIHLVPDTYEDTETGNYEAMHISGNEPRSIAQLLQSRLQEIKNK